MILIFLDFIFVFLAPQILLLNKVIKLRYITSLCYRLMFYTYLYVEFQYYLFESFVFICLFVIMAVLFTDTHTRLTVFLNADERPCFSLHARTEI